MKALVFFLVALALGTSNPIGPTTTKPTTESSQDDHIKKAIDDNVQWLLKSIRDRSLRGRNLARAVLALFLAEPEYFSADNEIGQELKNNITKYFHTPIFRWEDEPSFIPSEELALYVQVLVVSCMDSRNFFGYDLLSELWRSVKYERRGQRFPSSVLLALCQAGATSPLDFQRIPFNPINLSDEEVFTTMSIACLESQSPWNVSEIDRDSLPIRRSGYRYYPSTLTVEKLQEMMNLEYEPFRSILLAIPAAMQTLMYNRRLQVSDLSSVVNFLLEIQDEDGSWGQSALNSFFILPVLSNKSFLNISGYHCSAESGNEEDLLLENETEEEPKDYRRVVINIRDDSYILQQNIIHRTLGRISTLYDQLTAYGNINKAIYNNGTDGKPYLTSLLDKENNPETGYSWFTYEQTTYPKKTLKLLTQSHVDIKLRRDRKYVLWFSQSSV